MKPAASTVRTWARAIRHLSRNGTCRGIRAWARRSSATHVCGRYNSNEVNQGQFAGQQCRRHRDLAIGHLAQRAAILALLADRRGTLLRQPRVIDRQDAGPHRHHLAQPAPERARFPRRMGDEVLQALIRARVAQPPVHRLHRFAVAVVQKALEVPTGVGSVRAAPETRGELIEKRPEPRQQHARPSVGHASEGTESAVVVQVKLTK